MKKIKNKNIIGKTKFFIPILLLCLTLLLCFNTVSAADGDTIYVNGSNGNDSNDGYSWNTAKLSIKNATGTVNDNGQVNIANGQYNGTNNTQITPTKNMTINGESQAGTIINGTNTNWIFYVNSGISLILLNVTLTQGNGYAGGVIYNGGICTVTNCTITNNNAAAGGGIYNYYGTCTVTNCTINNNTAPSGGGGICNYGICTVTGSNITDNTANFGGGIYNNGDCTIINSTIQNNIVTNGNGGGICNYQGNCAVTGCTIQNNTVNNGYGGGIINYDNCTIINSTIQNNTVNNGYGGGILNYDNCTIINSTIQNNTVNNGYGGGIYNDGICMVTGSNITNNTANNGDGGGIYNYQNNCTAHFNRIYNNTATNGNALYCNSGTVNAENNWWGNNTNPKNITNLIVQDNQGTVNTDPWLIMTFTANPTTISPGQTSLLTASFNINSNNNTVGGPVNHIPDGIPVTFTTDSGKVYTASSGVVNSQSVFAYTASGVASAILDGDALLTANLDNQTLTTIVTFNNGTNGSIVNAASQTTSTGKTIGMQNTGIPIASLILAILALFGGIMTSKRK